MKESCLIFAAKMGYFSRAFIYFLISILALSSIIPLPHIEGKATNSKGAITTLLNSEFGPILLFILACGLTSYALWRFIQSIADIDNHKLNFRGIIIRSALLVSSLTHALLAYSCFKIVFTGLSEGGNSDSMKENIEYIISLPLGMAIVIIIGVSVLMTGISQFIRAYKKKYLKYMELDKNLTFVNTISKIGLCSKGLILILVGGFITFAGITEDSDKSGGLDQAWNFLGSLPYGDLLIISLSLGLLSFSIYSGVEGLYRKIDLN